MPLYEYECDDCSKRFERIQKYSDPLADTCPTCGGKVRKLLSSPAIQFKGSGFYINDYAKKGGGADSGKSGSAEKRESAEKSESKDKTDTPAEKPAAKSAEPAKSE
jgi:putative FmdB family regulatory protein